MSLRLNRTRNAWKWWVRTGARLRARLWASTFAGVIVLNHLDDPSADCAVHAQHGQRQLGSAILVRIAGVDDDIRCSIAMKGGRVHEDLGKKERKKGYASR